MSEVNNNAPFLLIQKPQELIKLFEGLIDRKIREIGAQTTPPPTSVTGESPFGLLPSIKIKSRRYFFLEHVQTLQQKWVSPGDQ